MKKVRGFTLIELMVVVMVIAILAALALSAYSKQVRKSRRAEAKQVLSDLGLKQETWRTNHATYGTLANLGGSPATTYYTVTLTTGSNTAIGYVFTAVPSGDQAKDTCGTLTWTMASGVITKDPTTTGCW
jgi:type IV pilus assembly protein PilE